METCGVEAILDNIHYTFRVIDLLRDIPIEEYEIYTPGCMVCPRDGFASVAGTLSRADIERLSAPPYYVEELSLHLFPRGTAVRRLENYADYKQSDCICSILYFDCADLEVYAKEPEWLRSIKENIKQMHPLSICDKTEDSDGRTEFF